MDKIFSLLLSFVFASNTPAPSYVLPEHISNVYFRDEHTAKIAELREKYPDAQKNYPLLQKKIKEFVSKKDWSRAVNALDELIAAPQASFDDFILFGLAHLRFLDSTQNANQWDILRKIYHGGYGALQKATTPLQVSQALFLLSDALDHEAWNKSYALDLYDQATTLSSLSSIRKSHPLFAEIRPFIFKNFTLDTEGSSPSLCFSFSLPLKEGQPPIVQGKTPASFKGTGTELCTTSLQYGQEYEFTLPASIESKDGEKTTAPHQIKLKIPDRQGRLSFKDNTYVFMKGEKGGIPLMSINVEKAHLQLFKVPERNLMGLLHKDFMKKLYAYEVDRLPEETGSVVWEKELTLKSDLNKEAMTEVPLDLPVTEPGVYILHAKTKPMMDRQELEATQWFIVSDMGLSTFWGEDGLHAFVRSLQTAKPLSKVTLRLMSQNNQFLGEGMTTREGHVFFPKKLIEGKKGEAPGAIYAFSKDDFSFMRLATPAFDLSDWPVMGRKVSGPMDAFLYTDRGVYRPGETIHLTGLLRDQNAKAIPSFPLTLKFLKPGDLLVREEILQQNEAGGFSFDLNLPSSAPTGSWAIEAYLDPKGAPLAKIEVAVEDFVPARLELSAESSLKKVSKEAPLELNLSGRYLFGAPAAGLAVEGEMVIRRNATPLPEGYSFGDEAEVFENKRFPLGLVTLDGAGKATLRESLPEIPISSFPLEVSLRLSLFEAGGRPVYRKLRFPIEKGSLIGLKPLFENKEVPLGKDAKFKVIWLEKDDHLGAQKLSYDLYREEPYFNWFKSSSGQRWQYKKMVNSSLASSGTIDVKGETNFSLPLTKEGQYRLEITDGKAKTTYRFYQGWAQAEDPLQAPDKLKVTLNKESYKVGEEIKVAIDSPFKGEATLVIGTDRVLETYSLPVKKGQKVISLKVKPEWGVGAYVLVSAYRPLGENDTSSPKPKRAVGLQWAQIDPAGRKLDISLDLPKETLPRKTIEGKIKVKNGSGKVFLTLTAVDEGILALTDFKTPNPLEYFFGKRRFSLDLRDLYGYLLETQHVGGDEEGLKNLAGLSKQTFKPLALYSGIVTLDDKGEATIPLPLPDFNGAVRVMATAFDADRVGSQDASILVRDPVVMDLSSPLFMGAGDKSEILLHFHNISAKEGEYSVTLQTEGQIVSSAKDLKVSLTKEATLSVPIEATKAGEGSILITLKGQGIEITKKQDLSVLEGTILTTSKEVKPLKPGETWTTPKGQLFLSSAAPYDVVKIVEGLKAYPYGCVEQTVSRAFGAFLAKEADKDTLNRAILKLAQDQDPSGCFGLWRNMQPCSTWLTAYVYDFFLAAGETVPPFVLEKTQKALEMELRRFSEGGDLEGATYALWLLTKAGVLETSSVRYFYETYFNKITQSTAKGFLTAALLFKGEKALPFSLGNTTGSFGTPLRDAALLLSLDQEVSFLSNEQRTTLLGQIQQELGSDLSTQEMFWLVRAASGFKEGTDGKATVAGKDIIVNAKGWSQKTEGQTVLKNTGSSPLWASVSVTQPLTKSTGLTLNRSYYSLEGTPLDLSKVKQKDQVVVVLEGQVNDGLRHSLLVADFIPAGFEIENYRLTGADDPKSLPWLTDLSSKDHVEMRDNRFVAALTLEAGISTFKVAYSVRATHKGLFQRPPAIAEDMYLPSVKGITDKGMTQIQ